LDWRELSAALSGGFISLTVLIAALAWRDSRALLQGRLLSFLAASVAALEICTGPTGQFLPEPAWFALRIAGGFNLGLLWLFCLAMLRDDFRIEAREWAVFAVLSCGPLSTMIDWPDGPAFAVISTVSSILPLAAIAHIAWIALSERRGDLVEGRLRARFWLPVILVALALISVASEYIQDPVLATLARSAAAGLPAALAAIVWMLGLDPRRLQFEPVPLELARPDIDPRDQVLLSALLETMDQGLYREPGVMIETLADKLSTPVHRLRVLINQGLGHRNFAAFVNTYRLAHARSALADPGRGRETILAIAFESGFGALQSFNRVFKQAEGETPSEYRAKRLGEAAQNQKRPPNS
jgi:AraC-like DNA-binding protein